MTLWDKRLEIARRQLIMMANTRNVSDRLIVEHCRLFLKAYYQGPWKMLCAITKAELGGLWRRHGFLKWEWLRTKVLRRVPNEALASAERLDKEDDAIRKLMDEL